MQVDLTTDELNELYQAAGAADASEELLDKLLDYIVKAEELENIDFDDCAGGACKL